MKHFFLKFRKIKSIFENYPCSFPTALTWRIVGFGLCCYTQIIWRHKIMRRLSKKDFDFDSNATIELFEKVEWKELSWKRQTQHLSVICNNWPRPEGSANLLQLKTMKLFCQVVQKRTVLLLWFGFFYFFDCNFSSDFNLANCRSWRFQWHPNIVKSVWYLFFRWLIFSRCHSWSDECELGYCFVGVLDR